MKQHKSNQGEKREKEKHVFVPACVIMSRISKEGKRVVYTIQAYVCIKMVTNVKRLRVQALRTATQMLPLVIITISLHTFLSNRLRR